MALVSRLGRLRQSCSYHPVKSNGSQLLAKGVPLKQGEARRFVFETKDEMQNNYLVKHSHIKPELMGWNRLSGLNSVHLFCSKSGGNPDVNPSSIIDTLKVIRTLEAHDVPAKQAAAIVAEITDILNIFVKTEMQKEIDRRQDDVQKMCSELRSEIDMAKEMRHLKMKISNISIEGSKEILELGIRIRDLRKYWICSIASLSALALALLRFWR